MDYKEKVEQETKIIERCIDAINEIDGIEARADTADWLARNYRAAATKNSDT